MSSILIITIPEQDRFVNNTIQIPCVIDDTETTAQISFQNAGQTIEIPKPNPKNPFQPVEKCTKTFPTVFIVEISGYLKAVCCGNFGKIAEIKMLKKIPVPQISCPFQSIVIPND